MDVSGRRAAAIGALVLGAGGLALAAIEAVQEFPRGLIARAFLIVASSAAWFGLLRTGAPRAVALLVGLLGFVAAIVVLASDRLLEVVVVVAALVSSCALARAA